MRLIEYRILMPLTVEENHIAQLWSMAEISRVNTGGGEGVEILKNELFISPDYYSNDFCKNLPDYEDIDTPKKNGSSKSLNIFKKSFLKRNSSFDNVRNQASVPNSLNKMSSDSSQDSNAHKLNKYENGEHYMSDPESLATNESLPTRPKSSDINPSHRGQYTFKEYRIASKFPWFIQKLLPKESLILHEKSWNMYPVIKTHIKNEFMKEKFHVKIDTITKICHGGVMDENIHNLSDEQLEQREIVIIDIAEPVSAAEYVEDEDPTIFHSKKTGRGRLKPDWITDQTPLICCYKLIDLEFVWFGLQTRSESYMVNMYKKLFKKFHRQVFCWIDKWYGLTIDDVRKYEIEVQMILTKKINEGQLAANQLGEVADGT